MVVNLVYYSDVLVTLKHHEIQTTFCRVFEPYVGALSDHCD